MSVDITSITIQAKSDGIDSATKSLNNLVDASTKAEAATGKLGNTSKASSDNTKAAASAVDTLMQRYQKQTDLLGATISQQLAYNVSVKGGSEAQVQAALALGAQQDAYKRLAADQSAAIKMNKDFNDSLNTSTEGTGHLSGGISGITRELIVLGHEASQGNFSRFGGSLAVMAEKFDVGSMVASAFGSVLDALGGSVMLAVAALATLAAAIGTVVAGLVTFQHSLTAIQEFNQALILTGGYAGTTGNQLYTMSAAIGQVYGNTGKAREAVLALANTGKFTADQINDITTAAVGLYTYGGVPIDKTIAQFEKLSKESLTGTNKSFDAVTRAAVELDEQLHFLEPATLAAAIAQEKLGNMQEAQVLITKNLTDVEKERAEELKANMTALGSLAHTVGAAFADMWNNLWTKKSPQQELSGVIAQLKELGNTDSLSGKLREAGMGTTRVDLMKQAAVLEQQISNAQLAADQKKAESDMKFDSNIAQNYLAMLREKEKGETELDLQIKKYKQAEFDAAATGQKTSTEQEKADIAELTKLYGEKAKKIRPEGTTGIDSQLAQIKTIGDAQQDAYSLELKNNEDLYKNKQESIQDYSDKKATLLALEIKNTQDTYSKEVEALLNWLAASNRTDTEVIEGRTKIYNLSDQVTKKLSDETAQQVANSNLLSDTYAAEAKAQQDATDKVVTNIQKKTQEIQYQIDAYNKLPASIRQAGVTEKQMADSVTQAHIDDLNQKIASEQADDQAQTFYHQNRIKELTEERDALVDNQKVQASKEVQDAQNAAIVEYNKKWAQSSKQIGDDIASAIVDGGGKGLKKLITDMELAFAKVILQPILAPISGAFASIATTVGASSPAGVGSAASAVSLASTASSLYSAISKGFDGIGASVANGVQSAFNFLGTSNAQGIGNSITAQTAGDIAENAAGAAVGLTLDKLISGKYQISSGVSAVESVATAVASASGPIAGSITGAVSGLLNRAFGHGPETVTSQGIRGTATANGTTGQAYQNIHADGGWFSSDINKTNTQALPSDVSNSLTAGIAALEQASSGFAKNLGLTTDAIASYSKAFDVTLTGDATKDQAAIAALLSGIGDDMANKLVPNLANFAKVGETASQTLQRLSDTFSATDQVANMLGKDSSTAFGAVGLASAATRQSLVDLAGGISNLQSETAYFATNFESTAEQIAPVQKAVNDAFAAMGVSAVSTIPQFDALVKSLDLSTQAGQEEFQNLMALAPAFKQVADATSTVTKAQSDLLNSQLDMQLQIAKLTNDTSAQSAIVAQQRAIEIAGLDASLQPLQQRINDLTDEAAATDAANTATAAKLTLNNSLLDLESQVAALTGDTAGATAILNAQRQAELATLDASLVPWQIRINQLTDEAAATKAANDAKAAQAAIDATTLKNRNDYLALEAQLAPLENDTALAANVLALQRMAELKTIDASLVPLQERINLITDEQTMLTGLKKNGTDAFNVLSAAITKAKSDSTDAYNAYQTSQQALIDTTTTANKALSDLGSALTSALDSLNPLVTATTSWTTAQQTLSDALTSAQNGVMLTADSLKDALSTLTKPNTDNYSSTFDYQKDIGTTAGKIADLNAITVKQKSVSDMQLEAEQNALKVATDAYNLQQKEYDTTLAYAQQQLDAMNGTQTAVKSVADALVAFNTTVNAAINYATNVTGNIAKAGTTPVGNQSAAPQTATTDQITALYEQYLGRAPDAAGLAYWQAAAGRGATASDIAQQFMQSSEYQSINGSHANGLDNVPFDGYTAKLHKGEMVLPAKQAQGVAQGSDMAAVVEAINNLKDDNSSENQAMASALIYLKKLFQNVSPNGQTLQVTQTVIS